MTRKRRRVLKGTASGGGGAGGGDRQRKLNHEKFSVGCQCNNSYDRVTLTDYLQEVKSLYNSQDILKEGKLTQSLKAFKRVEVT